MTLFSRYATLDLVNLLDEIYSTKHYKRNNVVPVNNNLSRLEIELAGFTRDNIEIYTESNHLYVKAKKTESSNRQYYGSWPFEENERIGVVKYENGLLSIEILKIVPEQQKRKNYKIE